MKKIVISLVAALIFAVALQSVSALSPHQSDYYSDVIGGQRYFEAIEFISDEGIVSGYPDGTYGPGDLLNRAELLKILIEAEYEDEFEAYANSNCFDDVEAGKWFTPYVCFAEDEGFVVGYDDGTFRPSDYINLVEAVKISMEVFGYDYAETEPWYKGPVDIASEANLIPLTFISFDQYVDRGDMADLITRILKFESGELSDYLGIWQPYVVNFDNLASNADTEPVYCVGDFQYMLVGGSYEPWDEAGTTCTCQADGNFDCEESVVEESLLTQVCGNDGEGACTEDKIAEYGCDYGYEATYGGNEFVKCGMWDTASADVLFFDGGLGSVGYNLIGDDGIGDLDVIDSVADLSLFWGNIADSEDALEFTMAATFENEAYSEADIEDLYGADFSFHQDVVLEFSDPIEIQDTLVLEWIIPLYYSPTFGCTPFPVSETHYYVSEDGTISTFADYEIGEIDNGLCVD